MVKYRGSTGQDAHSNVLGEESRLLAETDYSFGLETTDDTLIPRTTGDVGRG